MSITGNWCVTGVMNLRRAFPVDPDTVTKLPDREAYTATCPKCGRPNTPVVKDGGQFYFSGHTFSNIVSQYTKERERPWDRR